MTETDDAAGAHLRRGASAPAATEITALAGEAAGHSVSHAGRSEQLPLFPAPDGSAAGIGLGRAGGQLALQDHDDADTLWKDAALAELERLAATGRPFRVEELRPLVGQPRHPGRWGGLTQAAAKAKIIEPVGSQPCTSRSRHGGRSVVWVGTGVTRAVMP